MKVFSPIVALFFTINVSAQSLNPYVSSLSEAFVNECPKHFKYVSAEAHKKHKAENEKAQGKAFVADLVKGSREKIREKGGCEAAVLEYKTPQTQASKIPNIILK